MGLRYSSAFIAAITATFTITAVSAEDSLSSPSALVAYLNEQLDKSPYKTMRLHGEICEFKAGRCSYKLTETSSVEIVTKGSSIELIRMVAAMGDSDDFVPELKATAYLYSLIIWGKLTPTSTYDDANSFLSGLMDQAADKGAAVDSAGDWTFGVVATRCKTTVAMFVAIKMLSPSIKEITTLPARCSS